MSIQYSLDVVWGDESSREEQDTRGEEEEVMSIGTRGREVYSRIIYFDERSVEHLDMEWPVEEEDAGGKIMAYRADAIIEAAEGNKMTSSQTLILNYIVFFDMSLTIVHDIDMTHRTQAIKRQINRLHSYTPVSNDLSALCYRLLQLALLDNEGDNDFEQTILENRLEAIRERDEEKALVLRLFEEQYRNIKALNLTTNQSDVLSTLHPLLQNIFENIQGRGRLEKLPSEDKFLIPLDSASATSSATVSRKRRASSSSYSWLSLQPTYLLKSVCSGAKFDLFAVQVKEPGARVTQVVDDEVKLGNMLKLMVDRLVVEEIPSPVVCGLLVEDGQVKTYKMTITSNGRYEFVQLACFTHIHNLDDLSSLPAIVSHLLQLKRIICSMQQVIIRTKLGMVLPDPVPLQHIPVDWLRPSFEHPVVDVANRRRR